MLNAAILGAALYFLLYKPVGKFMKAREDEIKAKLDEAEAARLRASALNANYENEAKEAERKVASIIIDGQKLADSRAEEIIAQARADAESTAKRARSDAEKMIIEARESMRDEAADLAIKMASKLLSHDVSSDDHTRLINELIERS
jgi:F-type H+-transporting ATPase subunit b